MLVYKNKMAISSTHNDWIGIDYGSKLAGTTVCCQFNGNKFELFQSAKNQDADQFLLALCTQHSAPLYIDAPLSLPGVYRNLPGYSDYFYREADKSTKAMSPLFLGGLTARAMQLQAKLSAYTHCTEVYPAALARSMRLDVLGYKKANENIAICQKHLVQQFDFTSDLQMAASALNCSNWHQLDAFLAWCIGWKVEHGLAKQAGTQVEGLIYW